MDGSSDSYVLVSDPKVSDEEYSSSDEEHSEEYMVVSSPKEDTIVFNSTCGLHAPQERRGTPPTILACLNFLISECEIDVRPSVVLFGNLVNRTQCLVPDFVVKSSFTALILTPQQSYAVILAHFDFIRTDEGTPWVEGFARIRTSTDASAALEAAGTKFVVDPVKGVHLALPRLTYGDKLFSAGQDPFRFPSA